MQIEFFGANCLRVKDGETSLVFDDNLASLGAKSVTNDQDVVCLTNHLLVETPTKGRLRLDCPGEYEAGGFIINAQPARAHLVDLDEASQKAATTYKVTAVASGLSFLVLGHISPILSEPQLVEIGQVELVFVPVGGGGYTLDAQAAHDLVVKLEPKIVAPTYYQQANLKYPTPVDPVDNFLKLFDWEVEKVVGNYRLRKKDLPEQPKVILLG